MIERQGVYEIVYQKDQKERIWHISIFETPNKYGGRCIQAYCHEMEKSLFFNINKIVSAERYWIDIFDENETASKSGAYLFACRGDNHLVTELYSLKKGERIYKFFEGRYVHFDGWVDVNPVAYHYIRKFGKSFGWTYSPDQKGDASIHVERIIAVKAVSPLTLHSIITDGENDTQYCRFDSLEQFTESLAYAHITDQDIIQLGTYTYFPYTESNHIMHWMLHKQMHPKFDAYE